jgi:hypothetical protein
LNYTRYDAIGAVQLTKDRNNPLRLLENVLAGFSQLSHIPDNEEFDKKVDDWLHPMEELSNTEDYRNSRKVLSCHYNKLSDTFNNSKQKECLEEEFKTLMNQFIVRARGTTAVVSSGTEL